MVNKNDVIKSNESENIVDQFVTNDITIKINENKNINNEKKNWLIC